MPPTRKRTITVITGRDEMLRSVTFDAYRDRSLRCVSCWTWRVADHPVDAARAWRDFVWEATQDVVIFTLAEGIITVLGELVADGTLSPEQVEVVLCEDGAKQVFRFGADGVLGGGWPIGYFAVSP